MSLAALNDISGMLIQVFGHPAIITLFIIGFLLVGLVVLRAHAWVMLAIILPVAIVFAFGTGTLIFTSKSLVILLIFIMAFILSIFFMSFQR